MTEHQPEAPAIPGVTRWRIREQMFVDAIQWTGGNEEAVREFASGQWGGNVPLGCYVVRGVTGHFFTVDPERFAATYEPAGDPLVIQRVEFETLQGVAATLGMVAAKPCRCGPEEPCAAHPDTSPPVAAAFDPETARLREGARVLGSITARLYHVLGAVRIELAQDRPHEAMQWIVNSLDPCEDDPAAWDGAETAQEWFDRVEAADRAAEASAPAVPRPPVAAAFDPAEAAEAEAARLRAKLADLGAAARMLGRIVVGQTRAMEAARIELAQGRLYEAAQWILNSLPDVWDDPETAWDGRESANEWWDRTDGFYREAEKPVAETGSDDSGRTLTSPDDGAQARAEAAEAKLATIESHCRGHLKLPGSCCPHLAHEILAIVGGEEEPGNGC